MAIDALLKRFFPGIVLGLIALAAYFQGSGLVQLLTTGLLGGEGEDAITAWNEAAKKGAPKTTGSTTKSAEPILSRNPFDSVTGPLNAQPIDPSSLEGRPGKLDLSDPLSAANCGGVVAHIVTESTDPTWSIAVLQGPGDQKGKLRRVGDEVADKTVAYIGYNPRKQSPSVWLTNPSSLCQVLLFGEPGAEPARPEPSPAAADDPKQTKRASRGRRGRGAPVPKEIADKIQRVSETEFNVDRAVVDNILENQAQLMRSARIVPEQKNGKVVGIRMFGIRPNTLLGKLGMQNGDRLESINGFDMASPEKALEAYARLRTADNLSVKINRRGKPMTIDFRIK